MKRLRELDFLRGVAILLVLLKHRALFWFTTNMGWIGVDLFFVLSGFLVSGLLFKEFLEFGAISPKRFLIRRGFKIYPIYYIFYILYLIPIIIQGRSNVFLIFADLAFIQNYVTGLGYAYGASWSLAVEEHFYFAFSLLLWCGLRYKKITLKINETAKGAISLFEITMLLVMIFCLLMRIYVNLAHSDDFIRKCTMTHLRIDSLLAGVLVSYFYYFRTARLRKVFNSFKYVLLLVALGGVIWTPFIIPIPSFFARTFGFSFIYISFSIVLIYFLLNNEINRKLNKIFSTPLVNIVSKIGFCSYSIYIIHTFVNKSADYIISHNDLRINHYVLFLLTSSLSISSGMLMTYKIENIFLRIRDLYYPGRVKSFI